MAQPPSSSGDGLGFNLDLYGASPRVFECGLGFSSGTCMAQPPSASGDGLGEFVCSLCDATPRRASGAAKANLFVRGGPESTRIRR